MQKAKHSLQFKEQALNKARQRGKQTLETVAADLNMSLATLKGWLKTKPQSESLTPLPGSLPDSRPASQWSAAERLLALQETHTLSGTALHAWCREKGLFAHQLSAWREAFCSAPALSSVQDARESKAQFKALQIQHEFLQRDLRRKEKALAEAAALLVLQKKFQALFGQEE